jgi:hypothetical protein
LSCLKEKADVRLLTKARRLNTPTPIEHCAAPFLGLTVQPCGELCGSAVEFSFLAVVLLQIPPKKEKVVLAPKIYASG